MKKQVSFLFFPILILLILVGCWLYMQIETATYYSPPSISVFTIKDIDGKPISGAKLSFIGSPAEKIKSFTSLHDSSFISDKNGVVSCIQKKEFKLNYKSVFLFKLFYFEIPGPESLKFKFSHQNMRSSKLDFKKLYDKKIKDEKRNNELKEYIGAPLDFNHRIDTLTIVLRGT